MTGAIRITELPADERVRRTIATWSFEEWGRYFPDDTVQTYLDLYAVADLDPAAAPVVLVAWEGESVVGTVVLVPDDELPDPLEPGPWAAGLFVPESHRGRGIGRVLMEEIIHRARGLGHERVYLYTEDAAEWHMGFGWSVVRTSHVNGHAVTVMTRAT